MRERCVHGAIQACSITKKREQCYYLDDAIQQLMCLLQLIYRHIKDDMYVYLGAEHKYDFYLNPNVNSLNYYYNTISDKVIKIHINLELLSLAMSFYS